MLIRAYLRVKPTLDFLSGEAIMSYVKDFGNWSLAQSELAIEQAQLEQEQYARRLPPVL